MMPRRGEAGVPSSEVGYHDLLADLDHEECAVCRVESRLGSRYIDGLLWEHVNDAGMRARLRASHGFCREHALLAANLAQAKGDGSGMAILFEDLLCHLRDEAIRAARGTARGLFGTRQMPDASQLEPHDACPVCESTSWAVESYLRLLGQQDEASEIGRAARREGRGLCVRHLARGLALVTTSEEGGRLLDIYLRGEAELRAEMNEYVRKHSYQFSAERILEREASAWQRAVRLVVGAPPPEGTGR